MVTTTTTTTILRIPDGIRFLINWSTVAKDAGIGMLTLGVLDSKVGQKFTGFVGKVGNEVTPDWVKKGVTKANEGL